MCTWCKAAHQGDAAVRKPSKNYRVEGQPADRTAQRTIPVALDGLGVESAHDAELLAQAVQQPAGNHDLIAHVRGAHRANLELPLPGHHLRVDAADQQPGLHAHSPGF